MSAGESNGSIQSETSGTHTASKNTYSSDHDSSAAGHRVRRQQRLDKVPPADVEERADPVAAQGADGHRAADAGAVHRAAGDAARAGRGARVPRRLPVRAGGVRLAAAAALGGVRMHTLVADDEKDDQVVIAAGSWRLCGTRNYVKNI